MNHSPAPFDYQPSVEAIFDANGKRIAELAPNECEDEADIPTELEQTANALLFVASPDMLAALQAMKKAFGNCGASPFEQNAMDMRDAAIAKATGGTAPAPAVTVAECLEVLKQIRDGSEKGRWLDASGNECAEGEGEWTEYDQEEQTAWIESVAGMADTLIAKAEGRTNG